MALNALDLYWHNNRQFLSLETDPVSSHYLILVFTVHKDKGSFYERKYDSRILVTPTCSPHFAALLELFCELNLQTQYSLSQEPGLGCIKRKKFPFLLLGCGPAKHKCIKDLLSLWGHSSA